MNSSKDNRLFSLDLLRGCDMVLLGAGCALVAGVNRVWPLPEAFMRQFTHPWGGFTLLDIIMPLFIFMSGAAIPFALGRRLDENGKPTPAFWKHIASRFALLWVLGMCCQGGLLTFDPVCISPYCNTLQSIAAGYLITALVMLAPSKAFRIAMPIALVALYGLIVHLGGDYSKEGNVTWLVERRILSWIVPAESRLLKVGAGYTWFLPTMMFGAIALAGYHATEILRSARTQWKRAGLLAGVGAASLAVGWALVPWVPMIKQYFTVSFSLQAIGWCMLAYAALYVVGDIWKLRRGTWLVILFGQCSLATYIINAFFRCGINVSSHGLVKGLPRFFGTAIHPLVEVLAETVILIVILALWRQARKARRAGL